ncbi:hypothetical protein HPT27_02675 [Permianibacter sp. IMCC34836]|uniref:hypothetical protein n=1 Tax=Permianibacter fluminis TaxID=2738515 RepID=UPI0015540226|nr:hypothetical protein [Permianibacter fluminis]NQD35910.1 hypothetical protein [Permianibacter fluminis]
MKSAMTLTALAVLMAASINSADAGERGLRVGGAANAGAAAQLHRNRGNNPQATELHRTTNVTLANGQQASRTVDASVDRDNHSYSREVTGTTRAGVDYTVNVSGSRDPETGSFQRTIARSNSAGQSATTVVTGQRTEDGVVRDRTTTLADGRSASAHTEVVHDNGIRTVTTTGNTLQGEAFSRTATTTRTDSGVIRDVNASGPNGERSRHDEVIRDAATGTVSRTSSGANAAGEWTASAVTTRSDDGFVRDASRTTANGQTVSQHGELVRNDDGSWLRTQTTTAANGGTRTVTVNGSVDAETGARNRDVTVERNPAPAPAEPTP